MELDDVRFSVKTKLVFECDKMIKDRNGERSSTQAMRIKMKKWLTMCCPYNSVL